MAEADFARTLGGLLKQARAQLTAADIEDAALDARLIVEHFTGTTRTRAIALPDQPVDEASAEAVTAALARRAAGEPVHRIFGVRAFHGLTLRLNQATLEPRPDTETLVDLVAPCAAAFVARQGRCRILDLGTGTGAVALALLKEVPGATAVGVDISADALAMARANADINAMAERFESLLSDWFSAVRGVFHIIVSNPPYIATGELAALQPEVRLHDPRSALDGGADGLDAYRAIAAGAAAHMEPDGVLAVEIGSRQHNAVTATFAGSGFRLCETRRDLAGHERALAFRR